MKAKKIIWAFTAAAVIFSFPACQKKEAVPQKAAMSVRRSEVIDYQGAKVGKEIPVWVEAVVDGDNKIIAKELKLEGKKLWVFSNNGSDLDFLKIWTDKVDIQSEVAQSISNEIGRQSVADIQASSDLDEVTKKKAINDTTMTLSNVRVNGLEKNAQYWIKTRTPKVDKPKTDDDYVVEYTYYVVYSMETDSFELQMKEALKNVAMNTSQDYILQQIITAKIAQALLPENLTSIVLNAQNIDE